jgi:uncharacterized protein
MNPSMIPSRQISKRRIHYVLRLLIAAAVWTYILMVAGSAYLGAMVITQPGYSSICCVTPSNFDLEYESVSLTTKDDLRLSGWYIPSKNGAAILLLHGYGANRLSMLHHAKMLADHDYGVLLYDQRGSGESEGLVRSWGWADIPDVAAAINFVKGQPGIDAGRIGVLGCSIGGQIAVQAAAQQPELRAVIADAPTYSGISDLVLPDQLQEWIIWPVYPLLFQFIEWRSGVPFPGSLQKAIDQIPPRPLLIISTGQANEMRQAQHYLRRAGEQITLWNIPEASHCAGQEARPLEYQRTIVHFFDQALLQQNK